MQAGGQEFDSPHLHHKQKNNLHCTLKTEQFKERVTRGYTIKKMVFPKKGKTISQSRTKTFTHIILEKDQTRRSSYKEHREDALALGADEGRDKLR